MLATRLRSAALRRLLPLPFAASSPSRTFASAEDEERPIEVTRSTEISPHRKRDAFFSDALDPFYPSRSVSQMLNLMDSFTDLGLRRRRGWDAREDDDGLCLRVDMPGLDKDDVKVTVDQNSLVIRGERSGEDEGGERRNVYGGRIDLPPTLYKLDEIKGEIKNGVLKVFVPKLKANERKGVVHVQVE